ncbi:hypothetical protein ABIC46_006626 [Variovorax paradoxus]|jgi:hypothetical protein
MSSSSFGSKRPPVAAKAATPAKDDKQQSRALSKKWRQIRTLLFSVPKPRRQPSARFGALLAKSRHPPCYQPPQAQIDPAYQIDGAGRQEHRSEAMTHA